MKYYISFPQIIKDQLLKCFCIQVFPLNHLAFITRLLDFNKNARQTFGITTGMDHKIIPAFGIDIKVWGIKCIL